MTSTRPVVSPSQTIRRTNEAYVRVRIGRHRFAIAAEHTRRVLPATGITPIPLAPRAVLGAVNVRGRAALCLDPSTLVNGDAERHSRGHADTPPVHLLAIVHKDADLALAVDEVEALVRHPDAQVVPIDQAEPFSPPEAMRPHILGRLVPDTSIRSDPEDPEVTQTRDALRRLMRAVEEHTVQTRPDRHEAADERPDEPINPYEADHPVWIIDLDTLVRALGGTT